MNASLSIRWLIRRDLPHVLAIEQASFEHAWTEEDFLCCLRQRNCIGMVATDAGELRRVPNASPAGCGSGDGREAG